MWCLFQLCSLAVGAEPACPCGCTARNSCFPIANPVLKSKSTNRWCPMPMWKESCIVDTFSKSLLICSSSVDFYLLVSRWQRYCVPQFKFRRNVFFHQIENLACGRRSPHKFSQFCWWAHGTTALVALSPSHASPATILDFLWALIAQRGIPFLQGLLPWAFSWQSPSLPWSSASDVFLLAAGGSSIVCFFPVLMVCVTKFVVKVRWR